MTTAALSIIARLREAGATLECKDGGRVRFSASAPHPGALLAEARERREAIAAALTANAHEPPAAGDVVSSWGLTAEERRAALARLRPERSQAIAAVATSGALLAAPQDELARPVAAGSRARPTGIHPGPSGVPCHAGEELGHDCPKLGVARRVSWKRRRGWRRNCGTYFNQYRYDRAGSTDPDVARQMHWHRAGPGILMASPHVRIRQRPSCCVAVSLDTEVADQAVI